MEKFPKNAVERNSNKSNNTQLKVESNFEFPIWKRLLLLPYFSSWMFLVMTCGYIQASLVAYKSCTANFTKPVTKMFENFEGYGYYVNGFYLIDVMLIIIGKTIPISISPLNIRYPNWILCLELFSIFPFGLFSKTKPTVWFVLKFCKYKDWLKCLRIVNFFCYNRSIIPNVNMIKIFLEFAFYEITMIFILYLVTLHLTVHDDYMGSHSWAFYVSVINAASYGIEKYPITTAYIACTVCFGWCSFLWQTYFRAYCMWSVAERNLKYFKFRNKFHLIQTQLKNLNISKDVTESVDQFYITSCKLDKHSVKSWKNLAILPRSMEEEFSVEIYWFAFMHSKLFRNFELPFLRSLSLLMKSELTIPGEIVFDKSNLKDKMIYVQSGIIQILSGEDDETPLFSFSGGTCIGESSLILAHKSNTIVRCKTSCRLHILYRKDFNKFLTKNVRIYTQLRETFFQRLNQAKEDWALSQEIDKDCISDRINYMTVIWLKSTLHKLMSKDKTTFDKHVCQNVFLRDEFDEDNFKHRHFTAENLDLIAISERLQLVTDSVFVKSSCPCILQPNSVLVTLWDFSIAIVACTVCVILPYFAFLENSVPIWYEFYISIITVLWWIDLYLQASTAIKTPNRIIAHLESIIVYRIHSLSFLLDLFAAVPFEMFSPIIFVTSTKNNIIFLELNRVIKLQKIILIYRNWEKKLTSRNIIVTYCYYQLCILYITYILSCISFYVHRNGSSLSKENYFAWTFFDVNQLINGASVFNIFSENSEHTLYYGIISIFASFISIVYSVYVISTYYKIRLKISTSNKYYKNSGATFNSMAIASKYKKRIMKNIESQVENTSLPAKEYLNLPSSIYKKIAQEVFEPLLQDVPFFKHLPNEIITNLNMQCQITVIPQNEKICCTGQILNDLIILESGCCKTRSTTSSSELFIKAGNALAILESYTHKPVVNTIVTATHCRLLIISRTDFLRILSDYPLEVFHIETALSETDAKRELLHLYYQNNTYSAYKYILLSRNEKSIRTFGYHLEIDSYEEYDYYVPFDRLGHFSFIQYFLMRFTIYPNSNFLFIWELVRSVCAVTCGILFPLIYTNIATDRGLSSIMIFLDAMAWVDIYLRFHVCYYNDKGILVSHPLFTSQYYLKRAFVVDLLGVFPFKMFARTKSPEILTGLQLNRLLQMYRFLGFTKSVCQERPLQPSMTILFQLFPSIFALCFLISFINIISICSFTSSDTVICVNDSWAVFNNFVDPLTPLRLQLYNVYMVIGIVTRPGIQGYSIHSTRTMLTVYTLTVIKIIIFLYTSCLITKLYSTRTPSMWKNQNYMWRAIYFMQKYNVKKNLQNKFITYFELKFRQQNISTSISILHGALQEDLLYDVYGCVLNESSIFTGYGDSEHFFRSLLVEVSHDIIIKNSLAVQINDVNERISVIFKGTACVIGADGSTITFLSVGSFFGNLVESERSRQTVSVLAVGNIEILTAKTTKFYEILKKYSNLYHRYKRLIGFNVDYLKSKPQSSHGKNNDFTIELNVLHTKTSNPDTIFTQVFKILTLLLICYFEAGFTLYQIALGEYYLVLVILQYLVDAFYVLFYYVKTFRRHRYSTSKKYRCFIVWTLLPLDAFSWFLPYKTFRIVHSLLRINRPFRFIFLIEYLKEELERMHHAHSIILQTLLIFVWCTFLFHACTCATLLTSCSFTPNLNEPCNYHSNSQSSIKFDIYVRFFYITFNIFVGISQYQFYPVSLQLVLYFSILLNFTGIFRFLILGYIYSGIQIHFVQRNQYLKKIAVIINHMKQEQVSSSFYTKIINYVGMLWRTDNGPTFPYLLLELPQHLRESILNDVFSTYINNNPIFTKCHKDFKRQVVSYLKNETFFKRDYIVFNGSVNGCMYFVHDGEVQAIIDNQGERCVVNILKSGSYFGIGQGIFPGKPYLHSFQALKTTTILMLEFEKWKHLLDFFPASEETIYQQYYLFEDPYA